MACPFYRPEQRFDSDWPFPQRLPLGAGWTGTCTAPGHEGEMPAQDILEAFCNLGYASSCGWAPAERRWDAVRFAVVSPARSAPEQDRIPENAARVLRLTVVYEQNNRPAGQGELEFDLSTTTWLRRHEDARIQKMAECFLESYLKKRS